MLKNSGKWFDKGIGSEVFFDRGYEFVCGKLYKLADI